jgi:Transposase DDE domain group 1
MTDDNLPPFSFPSVARRKVAADFDGGRLTSDGGVMLLSMAERRLGVAERLARCFPDRRDPARITHTLADMIRARIFAISRGYEDADDLDFLRADPAFKLACGRLPDTGRDLCSQPTLSRLENAPSLKDAIRLSYALVDQWMASYEREPSSVTLDIDDTCDVVHGHQRRGRPSVAARRRNEDHFDPSPLRAAAYKAPSNAPSQADPWAARLVHPAKHREIVVAARTDLDFDAIRFKDAGLELHGNLLHLHAAGEFRRG